MAESVISYGAVSAKQQRHISVQRFFEISLLLMLGTGFLTLSTTGKLDAVSIGLFSAALGVKLWTYARGGPGFHLGLKTVNRACAAYLVFLAFDLTVIESGPSVADHVLAATVHLILFITVMKVFSARRYRDYLYLAALSFLMILASAVLTIGPAFVAGLALFVFFSICMLISFEIKSGMDHAAEPPPGPFARPQMNRAAIEISLAFAALGLALAIGAVSLMLFFAIPRIHTSYLGRFAGSADRVTGFSSSVRLGDIGAMLRSNRVVMRIEPEDRPERFEGIFWRGVALTDFTGRAWYGSRTGWTELRPAGERTFVLPRPAERLAHAHHLLRYRVLLSDVSTNVIFAAVRPVELVGPFAAINVDGADSIRSTEAGDGPVEYSAISDVGAASPTQLRRDNGRVPEIIAREDLELPPLDPRIGALARRITASSSTNYDRAFAIQTYLRRNFGYTLNPRGIRPSDPVGSFLFRAREGYCAYFAAAMAVMLRTIGVPARVVNGFRNGEYNPVGQDFVVRARDAHSWVEVYFPGYGWATFNPTPLGGAGASAPSRLEDYLDAASLFWSEWVVNYDSQHQALLGHQAETRYSAFYSGSGRRLRAAVEAAERSGRSALAWARLRVLPLAVVGLIFGLGLWLLLRRGWLQGRRLGSLFHRNASPESEASLAYRRLLRALRRKGIERLPSVTPRELAVTLAASQAGPSVAEFTRLYYEMRFGKRDVAPSVFAGLIRELQREIHDSSHGHD